MKDLFVILAGVCTALAACTGLLLKPRLADADALQAELTRQGMRPGAARAEATRRLRQRKLLLLGVPLALALAFSVAALFAGDGDERPAQATTPPQAGERAAGGASASRCRDLLGAAATAARPPRRGGGASGRRGTESRPAPTLVALGPQGRPAAGAVTMRIALGSDRDPVVRRQTFRVAGVRPRSVQLVSVNDFTDAGGGHALPIARGQLQARTSAVGGTRRLVHVWLCYDPTRPETMRPGSYTGGLMVVAGRATAVPIAMTITARDERFWPPLLAALLGLVAGVLVRIGADRRWGPIVIDWGYVVNFRFWVMVGGGVSAAAYSYLTIYEGNPAFDGSVASLWQLTAQTFAGTLASKALTDLIGPTAKEIRRGRARRQTLAVPAEQLLRKNER